MRSKKQDQILELILFQVCRPTEKAICVSRIEKGSDGHKAVWLPKSQVEYRQISSNQYEVEIPQWLAERSELA